MKFAIRSAVRTRYSPNPEGYPYFCKRGQKSFKWCGSLKEAHVFSEMGEVPKKFKTASGLKISKKYRIVPVDFAAKEETE